MENFGHWGDADLASYLHIAAPFFFDIGNGLRKYRESYMKKLLSLPESEAEGLWQKNVTAMKTWERRNDIPDAIASTYPPTLADAMKYYKPSPKPKVTS
jgi:hypothetical protein